MRPFRFAVQTSTAPDMVAWRQRARRAEALGYSCLYVPDHFDGQYGPLVAMTVAAEATMTLRVGSLVFDNDYRHPLVLAKEIATLDLASDGRVEFGLGAGWRTTDYEQSGIVEDPPSTRVDRLAESLRVMKALWATGRCDFEGVHYRITGAQGDPRPISRPHPPIVIGGGGRKILGVAAREADIVGVIPSLRAGAVGPEVAASSLAARFDERVAWIKQAAGARFDQLELQTLTFAVMIVPNRADVLEKLAPTFGVTPAAAAEVPLVLVGTVEEVCGQLVARRQRWGFSYIVIHDADMEAFAPVVDELAGT